MASQFASVPASVVALPFLLSRMDGGDLGWTVRAALAPAIAAERAVDSGSRTMRARLAYLICELGFQLRRRDVDIDQPLPMPRVELADALATNLCKVKRTMALFVLSGVAETDCYSFRILNWHRLALFGGYDPARLGLAAEAEDDAAVTEEDEPTRAADGEARHAFVTAAGDQACFV